MRLIPAKEIRECVSTWADNRRRPNNDDIPDAIFILAVIQTGLLILTGIYLMAATHDIFLWGVIFIWAVAAQFRWGMWLYDQAVDETTRGVQL